MKECWFVQSNYPSQSVRMLGPGELYAASAHPENAMCEFEHAAHEKSAS